MTTHLFVIFDIDACQDCLVHIDNISALVEHTLSGASYLDCLREKKKNGLNLFCSEILCDMNSLHSVMIITKLIDKQYQFSYDDM